MEVEEKYEISKHQLGKNHHSKVYSIKEKNTGKVLIVKIFEESRSIFHKNETNILGKLYEKYFSEEYLFFAMYKDITYNCDMFKIPNEVKGNNLEYLFYDYLSKLSLIDYVNNINYQIHETYVQYLTYRIITSIEKMHLLDICHNKIDVSNIMFDKNYYPKLIHFSEANIINYNNEKYQLNQDLYQLGKTLAKILTLGKLSSINYNKTNKTYIINGIAQDKKVQMEESKFWKLLKNIYNIEVSKQFLNFFHILINAKKSKELVNIKDLLNNEWICHIYKDIKKHETNFKNVFRKLFDNIVEDYEKENTIHVDIENILEIDTKEYSSNNDLKYPEIPSDKTTINKNEGDLEPKEYSLSSNNTHIGFLKTEINYISKKLDNINIFPEKKEETLKKNVSKIQRFLEFMKYEARIIEEKKIMKEKEKLCMIKKQQIERTKTEQKEIKKEEIEIQGKEELNKTEKK